MERAAPCYREGLELFAREGNETDTAHMRFRIAANMTMRGETAAAWPLIEDSLREARKLGSRVGESQALAFLVQKAYAEGDLASAIELALESAAIAGDVGWEWWEAGQFGTAASLERERGNFDAAETYAYRSLEAAVALGDRQHLVFAAASLASIAADRGDAETAGRLWGAVESEAAMGRVGQWEREQAEARGRRSARRRSRVRARRAPSGLLMSILEAAGVDATWPT